MHEQIEEATDRRAAQSTALDAFGIELLGAIYKIREPVNFAAGERIFEQDTEAVLGYVGPGDFLGEEALLGGGLRWASAIAETDVEVARVPADALRRLY